ncbi:MAG: ABC transporter permease [Opitutales bacterium]
MRYLSFNRITTLILVCSMGLIAFIPAGLQVLVSQSSALLTERAESTPLIIGAKGSPLELVLNAMHFSSGTPEAFPYHELERALDTEFATVIPLNTRFRSNDYPIVGTSFDYFEFRNLGLKEGRMLAQLGECVIGASVAEALSLEAGDSIISSPEGLFDFAGVYPLKMTIVGVLEATGSSDDLAVFTDLKTVWVISGLAHGHDDLEAGTTASHGEENSGPVVGNASVRLYQEITDANRDSFHFHGDPDTFPITGLIAIPRDSKSEVLLEGRYQSPDERMQVLHPDRVIASLMDTVLTARDYIFAGVLLVGGAVVVTAFLVFQLSFRLRKREFETMERIGISKVSIRLLLSIEIFATLMMSLALAAVLTFFTSVFGKELIESLIW